ncbi:uncharacterized protein TRIADDRAFT_28604 [Trichoplax adhaerens]|uniref:U2A'/phosphoprotein 32 family A C-terminal domain-containing protein n=1 Tax=Trichoplax adhaerens TaxID=10228 RepID=B3S3U5_TRIAD|nr:hypothetical protein TRIADDRAFT_28604 [Trichoplax adhaerens]EDV22526.1 hypothetical protein TRIADDRAFT_28604 [Trichoplax adhaerens]|eukprot:XP_002115070.1 hypothetical protein TRIADDRAFT_28604 [Trichoplax adhaerens]
MVKLTADLIAMAPQFTNAVKDRELDLRGNRITILENLGATLDQFDTIDFSDNGIRKLEGFPLLRRLKCILLNNNQLCRIGSNLEDSLPMLEELILTCNNMQELGDIEPLSTVKTLKSLCLLKNPIANKKHYRLYVIYKLPHIKLLDFLKVKEKERIAAEKLFAGSQGKDLLNEIGKKSKTFMPGEKLEEAKAAVTNSHANAIKEAIAKANTLEEVQRLEVMLKAGQYPDNIIASDNAGGDEMEVEEVEMES